MEIDYNLIIKYLVKDKEAMKPKLTINNFTTQKNICNYSVNFPDKFRKLLSENFYRYGVLMYDNNKNNISLWSSLLTLIDDNFNVPFKNDENEFIINFKNQLVEKYKKSNLFFKNIDKNDIREKFRMDPDIYVLQYIVDILDFNIIIWDFSSENIYSVYHKDKFNPFKSSIMLAKFNNLWEPIMAVKSKGIIQRIFDNNDLFFKNIYSSDLISYFQSDIINKSFLLFDINDIINKEFNKDINKEKKEEYKDKKEEYKENKDDGDSDSTVKTEDDVFIDKDDLEEIKKIGKSKINKMKLLELLELSKKLKIVVNKKSPTRADLIGMILLVIK